MDLASSARVPKTGLGGKGLLQSHLWCPSDLVRLLDRLAVLQIRKSNKDN